MEKRKRPPLPIDASPQVKYDNLILTFFEVWQGEVVGQIIDFNEILDKFTFSSLGFNHLSEIFLYVDALVEDELLSSKGNLKTSFEDENGFEYNCFRSLQLSVKGLSYCHSLLESGKNSTRCFVAMAFQNDMAPFYTDGISKAIEVNGFRPIRIDNEHTENEQTINDFIIASIKQSRFCIADLTHQRNGVYFEAGYALGRGLKVIYTCHRKHHKKVHFDLKTMQTILYDTPDELCEALSLKIQAFILD